MCPLWRSSCVFWFAVVEFSQQHAHLRGAQTVCSNHESDRSRHKAQKPRPQEEESRSRRVDHVVASARGHPCHPAHSARGGGDGACWTRCVADALSLRTACAESSPRLPG